MEYDSQPFVGQVLKVVGNEIEVSCMQQSGGNNAFKWPHPPDIGLEITSSTSEM